MARTEAERNTEMACVLGWGVCGARVRVGGSVASDVVVVVVVAAVEGGRVRKTFEAPHEKAAAEVVGARASCEQVRGADRTTSGSRQPLAGNRERRLRRIVGLSQQYEKNSLTFEVCSKLESHSHLCLVAQCGPTFR